MLPESENLTYQTAVRDFDRARKRASMRQLFARLRGKSDDLFSYNEVYEQLNATGSIERGLQEVPLDAIVGSVGRYQDFTRDFLPKRDSDEARWAGVRAAITEMKGMPPIDLYQIGEAYFVNDGNHRVSVARQLGVDTISAYVTEVETRVPLTPEDDPEKLIVKARYADFLEQTNLDQSRPQADLSMTFVGHYRMMLEQIETHRQKLSEERETTTVEAAASWYDTVYLPVVELIRAQGLLRNFPKRTEADIYIFSFEHCEAMEDELGWEIDRETAVVNLADKKQRSKNKIRRVWKAIVPEELEDGPQPGQWRRQQIVAQREDYLFADILVALTGKTNDWNMLEQVIKTAKWDHDRLLGLHVVSKKSKLKSPKIETMRQRFEERCREAGLVGEFAVEVGEVASVIIRRAAWVDMVVVGITHPPGEQPLARMGHGLNTLIQRCPRPILALPAGAETHDMGRLLLAYDGSPKADEALYVAAYLTMRRNRALTVVTVETDRTSEADMQKARTYLERYGIVAEYLFREEPIADAIMKTAVEQDSSLLIVGGFGFRPLMHMALGSAVDRIIREFKRPILICR